MLMEFILSISLILPGFWILRFTKVKARNNAEQLAFSYILSLVMMFSLLYLGSIMNAFHVASLVVLAIVAISSIHLFVLFAVKVHRSPHLFQTVLFSRISTEKLAVVVSITGLLSIYVIFLFSRAILDSDVVHEYLPIAKEIVRGNGFTYSNGYDYNVLLKPIGVSVLYAWTYVVSGSTLSESFRLLPLVPILTLIALNYAITTSATKSKTIGIISTALFLVFPFHDRFLLYTAAYPDLFYYPLIFAATFFLLEYSQSKLNRYMFWSGLALGAASLLKAQTIYFLIAFVLVFIIFELRSFKKFSTALCVFTPFYILVPSILAGSIQREGFRLFIPSFSEMQLELLLFLSILSGFCYYVTVRSNISRTKADKSMITCLVKRITLLLLPFAVLSSFWYVNNLLKFGTLISTSSINLANYDWALEVLKSIETIQPTADIWHYFAYFVFMFVDPAVMGYIMLITLLIGLVFVLRNMSKNFSVLFLYGIISATIILSTATISLPSAASGYNPRDILPLAPLLTTLSAIGIVSTTSNICKKSDEAKNTFVSLLLVAYFGLLSYIHSVYVWFTDSYNVTAIGGLMSSFGYSVGLNLMQTSFQLSYADRATFVGDNILRIVSLSLIVGFPVLALMIRRHFKLFSKGHNRIIRLERRVKKTLRGTPPQLCSSRRIVYVKTVFVISLMLFIIIIPRIEMLMVQGGPQEIKENQLKRNYGSIYELFADPREFDGDVLTFKAPLGLPYYLPGVKIIDLAYPANLAFLKGCFQSIMPYEAVVNLSQQGIRYLLINPSITQRLDASLNSTIFKIIQDPELSILSHKFGSWWLYHLGPYSIEKTSIPFSGWTVDSRYTNASYTLSSDDTGIFLELRSIDTNSRVTIVNFNLPKLNLSSYDYVLVKVESSSNSRILIRFWLNDGTGFDVVYWGDPFMTTFAIFNLKPYSGKMLREAYIGLKSDDGLNSYIKVLEISFVKLGAYHPP